VGNTTRVLPRGRSLNIHWESWQRPPIFDLIQRTGSVPEEDMRQTFNLGIGLIIIVPKTQADAVCAFLKRRKEAPIVMGEVS